MKKVLYLLLVFMSIVGIIGAIGYLVYYKQYPIAICQCVVGGLMYPTIKELIQKLQS